MVRKNKINFLREAKKNKNDEFYTQLEDIEKELAYYKNRFKGKVIYCNCDDPLTSNFFKYFFLNFRRLGLKKLISSCYSQEEVTLFNMMDNERSKGYYYVYEGEGEYPTLEDVEYFSGNGDFRSEEAIELLEESDIVVTNPPFSLFRDFVNLMIRLKKDFLIIGNINAITYKEIFELIHRNKVWLGIHLGRGISGFIVPKHYELYGTETKIDKEGNRIISPNNCLWITTLDNEKRHVDLPLTESYIGNENKYLKYDNYDAININKTSDIPRDYDGVMGVPITFLHKYNPSQFEIVGFRKGNDGKDLRINGKPPYFRILIRKNKS